MKNVTAEYQNETLPDQLTKCSPSTPDEKWYDSYPEKTKKKIMNYLATKEFEEWQSIIRKDNSLTVENARKIFEEGNQWWNTYADNDIVHAIDKNGPNCSDVKFERIEWNKLFEILKNNKSNTDYNLHYYAEYICIFVHFRPDGINLCVPFINEYGWDYIREDFENGRYSMAETITMIKESPKNSICPELYTA